MFGLTVEDLKVEIPDKWKRAASSDCNGRNTTSKSLLSTHTLRTPQTRT